MSLVTATATGSHGTHELQSAAGAGAPPLRRNCQVGDGGRSAAGTVEPSVVSPAQRVTKAGLKWYSHQCEKIRTAFS